MESIWRTLTETEEAEFRKWSRDNFNPVDDLIGDTWHPICKSEAMKMCREYIEKNPSYLYTRAEIDFIIKNVVPNFVIESYNKEGFLVDFHKVCQINAEACKMIPEFKREDF